MQALHQPVLLKEVIEQLNIKPNGIYVDATLGRCGHSQEICRRLGDSGHLFAFDQDQEAIEYGKIQFNLDPRVTLTQANFSAIPEVLALKKLSNKIDGVLFDLGICSTQVDDPKRGFSFRYDAPLDMRMDRRLDMTAADLLKKYSEKQLAFILKNYGEESAARRIAREIAKRNQARQYVETTFQLVELVLSIVPFNTKKKIHPATKTFQALRIAINDELNILEKTLPAVIDCLAPGGRLIVISFHSLEDRIVKNCFRQHAISMIPAHIPIKYDKLKNKIGWVSRAIKPSEFEINQNPRARSAVLRVAERNEDKV